MIVSPSWEEIHVFYHVHAVSFPFSFAFKYTEIREVFSLQQTTSCNRDSKKVANPKLRNPFFVAKNKATTEPFLSYYAMALIATFLSGCNRAIVSPFLKDGTIHMQSTSSSKRTW
jgi:hypothetical protein